MDNNWGASLIVGDASNSYFTSLYCFIEVCLKLHYKSRVARRGYTPNSYICRYGIIAALCGFLTDHFLTRKAVLLGQSFAYWPLAPEVDYPDHTQSHV